MSIPQRGHQWVVRQVARCLRYQMIDRLIGRTLIVRSLDTMLADVQAIVNEFCQGTVFNGPEQSFREGALAKYGILDLRYDVPASMAATQPWHALSLLKELGLVQHFDNGTTRPFDEKGERDYFIDLLAELNENRTILKLFLKECRGEPVTLAQRNQWMNQPTSIPFPKTMKLVDACITNLNSVWLNKHFYM